MNILAVDIGGSSIKAAVVERAGDDWRIVQRLTKRVEEGTFDELRTLVESSLAEALANCPQGTKVGISTTGSVDRSGTVLSGGFFAGYKNISWRDILRATFGERLTDVIVANDGRCAAWGSYVADPIAKGKDLVHFVVGTGVGGGMAIGGRPVFGAHGLAGNFGHVKVTLSRTRQCVCGRRGCVEIFAAAPAVLRYATKLLVGEGDDLLSTGDTLSIEKLSEAARQGSRIAISAFKEAGTWLGRAIADVANVLDPGVVTIGGGVIAAARLGQEASNPYVEAATISALSLVTARVSERLEVKESGLLNDAGLIGAAALTLFSSGM